jgi:hypothetical protein
MTTSPDPLDHSHGALPLSLTGNVACTTVSQKIYRTVTHSVADPGCLCLQRIIELSTQKLVIKLSKIQVMDPESGKKPIPDPG